MSIPFVVEQHVEGIASLALVRAAAVTAPNVNLRQLARLDERLTAHVDGALVAGDAGLRTAWSALASAGPGEVFAAGVLAILARRQDAIERLLTIARSHADAEAGLGAAMAWLPAASLEGLVTTLLRGTDEADRRIGLQACSAHRVDPGTALVAAFDAACPELRRLAITVAGTLGRRDLLPRCLASIDDDDPSVRLAAAQASLLLGDRSYAPAALHDAMKGPDPWRAPAAISVARLDQALSDEDLDDAGFTANSLRMRRILVATLAARGAVSDMPFLISLMRDETLARAAGEAFSLISGVDLALENAEVIRSTPATVDRVDLLAAQLEIDALDQDEGLPWPDADRVAAWWEQHRGRFASGNRWFMGNPPNAHGVGVVLRTGFQRQRVAAAIHDRLLEPGTVLFPTDAPVHRQRRLLGMGR